MSWRKEHREHPTFTVAQAKQIAADHRKLEHKRRPQKGTGNKLNYLQQFKAIEQKATRI